MAMVKRIGVLTAGGTILGSSNRANPFRAPVTIKGEKTFVDQSDDAMRTFERYGLDLLVVIGGDGSLSVAHKLGQNGIPTMGVPKTIDNDLAATDVTFGFDTALATATDALDMLHTTAESHHRTMLTDSIRLGGVGHRLAGELEQHLETEVRSTVLGHVQRGGSPTPFDRILGTRFGVHAARCAAEGKAGVMVALRGTQIVDVPLADAVSEPRRVDPDSELVATARSLGMRFGNE